MRALWQAWSRSGAAARPQDQAKRGQVIGIDIPVTVRVAQRMRGVQQHAVVTQSGEFEQLRRSDRG